MQINDYITELLKLALSRSNASRLDDQVFHILPAAGSTQYDAIASGSIDHLLHLLAVVELLVHDHPYLLGLIEHAATVTAEQNRPNDAARLLNFGGLVCIRSGRDRDALNYFNNASIDADSSGPLSHTISLNRSLVRPEQQSLTLPTPPPQSTDAYVRTGLQRFGFARREFEYDWSSAMATESGLRSKLAAVEVAAHDVIVEWGVQTVPAVEVTTYVASVLRQFALKYDDLVLLQKSLSLAETASLFAGCFSKLFPTVTLNAQTNYAASLFEYSRAIELSNLGYAVRRLGAASRSCAKVLGESHPVSIRSALNHSVGLVELARQPVEALDVVDLSRQAVECLERLVPLSTETFGAESSVYSSVLNTLALAKLDVAFRTQSTEAWREAQMISASAASVASRVMGVDHPTTRRLHIQTRHCKTEAERGNGPTRGGVAVLTRPIWDFPTDTPEYVSANSENSSPETTDRSVMGIAKDQATNYPDSNRPDRSNTMLSVGDRVSGRIVRSSKAQILLDVSGHSGSLDTVQTHIIHSNGLRGMFGHGATVPCVVASVAPDGSFTAVAVQLEEYAMSLVHDSLQSGRAIEGVVMAVQDAKLTVYIGVDAVLPLPALNLDPPVDPHLLVRRSLRVRVTELNLDQSRISVELHSTQPRSLSLLSTLEAGRLTLNARVETSRESDTTADVGYDRMFNKPILVATIRTVREDLMEVESEDRETFAITKYDIPLDLLPFRDLTENFTVGDVVHCAPAFRNDFTTRATMRIPLELAMKALEQNYPVGSHISGRFLLPDHTGKHVLVRLPGGLLGRAPIDAALHFLSGKQTNLSMFIVHSFQPVRAVNSAFHVYLDPGSDD